MTVAQHKGSGRTQVHRSVYESRIGRADVDFGTYHHSTPEESTELRRRAERSFSRLLRSIYPSGAPLRILDAGCGLGFLMYVAAKCFTNANITGVDLFRHGSISGISMGKAAKNMKFLGIDSRTSFLKHDLTKPMKSDAQYDLAVSNLVFHNMGNKRFRAYGTVFEALKPGAFFVMGDLFPHDNDDMEYFRECSTLIDELDEGDSGPWAYKVKALKKA